MKKALKTNVITAVFFVATIVTAQFRPNVFPDPVADDSYEGIDYLGQEDIEDSRFSHQQRLSASFSFYKGVPISSYAYSNIFEYKIREDLRADLKVHGVMINPAYQDLWGSEMYLKPHMAMDAGLKYSPMNNGLFDIHARTYHRPAWSGQSVYLTLLGIPIKRLYSSKSFNENNGPHYPGFID